MEGGGDLIHASYQDRNLLYSTYQVHTTYLVTTMYLVPNPFYMEVRETIVQFFILLFIITPY